MQKRFLQGRSARLCLVAAIVALIIPIGAAQIVRAGTVNVSRTGSDVPTCGSAAAACKTITYAVTNRAQTGDTVTVGPGTFPEGVSIGKAVTIMGAGAGNTKIDGGGAN